LVFEVFLFEGSQLSSGVRRTGARIIKPLTVTAWGTKAFYVEDPDGYIVCFGGRPAVDEPA
jgi:uncharacterized glyoxalase superfamily protein PhnB